MRLLGRQSAAPHRFLKRLIRVRNFERNVAHAVAMSADMFGRIIVGRHGRRQNEICLALTHGIRRPLSVPGFQSAVSDLRKTESLAIKVSRLPRVAHPEFDVVNAFQLEWILHPIPPTEFYLDFTQGRTHWSPPISCYPSESAASPIHPRETATSAGASSTATRCNQ